MNTRRIVALAFFLLAVTPMTFAESPHLIGAWNIYTRTAGSNSTVLLQTPAVGLYGDTEDGSTGSTLNVICKNHKLRAIALHTISGTNRHAVSDIQNVPTTPVVSIIEGQIDSSEEWGVSEKGHTFYPFSERFQRKVNKHWIERLSEAHTVVFRLNGSDRDDTMQPTFDTEDLWEALSSVGCTN